MKNPFSKSLTKAKIKKIWQNVEKADERKDPEAVWQHIQPLLKAQAEHENAFGALISIVYDGHLTREQASDVLEQIYDAHKDDISVVTKVGSCLENVRDIDDLNAPPPEHPLIQTLLVRLMELSLSCNGTEYEENVLEALCLTARLMARQQDEVAERSYKRLTEVLPDTDWVFFNYGLFLKTRGRFEEGIKIQKRALELSDEPGQAYYWNLGICATGAGNGERALEIWKGQEQNIEMGRFDLPEGGYPSCKVRLAEFPLAERGKENDYPGLEETIWIERLSPCHGIIRSVMVQNLGIDYGDVIMFDGAPYTYHTYGDKQIPVFPHLSTLRRLNYQFYDFVGTQDQAEQISSISGELERDAVVYVHTENYKILCMSCFRDPDTQHEKHDNEEHHVVTGRIAAPPEMNAKDLLAQIDAASAAKISCRIFSPDLCAAAGDDDRSKFEQRQFDILSSD